MLPDNASNLSIVTVGACQWTEVCSKAIAGRKCAADGLPQKNLVSMLLPQVCNNLYQSQPPAKITCMDIEKASGVFRATLLTPKHDPLLSSPTALHAFLETSC